MSRHRLLGPAFYLGLVFLAGAVGLAGWIAALWSQQSDHAVAHHMPTVKATIIALLVASLLAVVVVSLAVPARPRHSRRGDPLHIPAAITAVVAFVMAWFMLVPNAGRMPWIDAVFAVVVLPSALAVAVNAARGRTRRPVALGLVLAVVVLAVALALPVVRSTPADLTSDHLRPAWIGLDVAEWIAVLGTGVSLLVRGRSRVMSAVLAGLLLCDAAVNITASSGRVRFEAAVMACVEVPVALLCLVLAARSTARQPRAAAMRA